jgi:hypothetical protein
VTKLNTTPATLGPDDEILAARIDDMRKRLLNLGKNNKLLSTSFATRTRSHVRIIDASIESLFSAAGSKGLEFCPLPPFDAEPADEQKPTFITALEEAMASDLRYLDEMAEIDAEGADDAPERQERALRALKDRLRTKLGLKPRAGGDTTLVQHAINNGINPAFDLVGQTRDCEGDARLLMVPDNFERTLSRIHDGWRSELQETGISTLFIAFGFLEWRESDTDSRWRHAPLLLLPAAIERVAVRGIYTYSLKAELDELQGNVTLRELLRTEHQTDLPEPEAGETPEAFWKRVQASVEKRNPSWKIRSWVAVGLWPFARMAMYVDLDRKLWPFTGRPLVRDVFFGRDAEDGRGGAGEGIAGEETRDVYDVEHPDLEAKVPDLILDADSSQHSAVIDAMGTQSLALQGPPGTGKSQTITNIIAAALSKGETILFVAEKMAALDVVHKRLRAANLGPYCLELHSQATRKSVASALKARLEATAPASPVAIEDRRRDMKKRRDYLNGYVSQLNSPLGTTGLSVQEAIWAATRQQETHPLPPPLVAWSPAKAADAITVVDIEFGVGRIRAMLESYARCTDGGLTLTAHPWRGTNRADITPIDRDLAWHHLTDWQGKTSALKSAIDNLDEQGAVDATSTRPGTNTLLDHAVKIVEVRKRFPADVLVAAMDGGMPASIESLAADIAVLERLAAAVGLVRQDRYDPDLMREVEAQGLAMKATGHPLSSIANWAARARALASAERRRADVIAEIGQIVGRSSIRGRDVLGFLSLAGVLEKVSTDALRHRAERLANPLAKRILADAAKKRAALRAARDELERAVDMDGAKASIETLATDAGVLQRAGLFSFLSSDFRAARNRAIRLARGTVKKASELAYLVERARQHIVAEKALETDARLVQLCDIHHAGLDTDFDMLLETAMYLAKAEEVAGTDFLMRRFLSTAPIVELAAFRRLVLEIADHANDYAKEERTVEERVRLLERAADALQQLATRIAGAGDRLPAEIPFGQLALKADAIDAFRTAAAEIERKRLEIQERFPPGALPTTGPMLLRLVADARAVAGLPGWLQACALSADSDPCSTRDAIVRIADLWHEMLNALETMAAFLSIDLSAFFDHQALNSLHAVAFAQRADDCATDADALTAWTTWLGSRAAALEAGVLEFVETSLSAGIAPEQIPSLYVTAVRRAQVSVAFQLNPNLGKLRGTSIEQARREFQDIDLQLRRLGRDLIASRVHARRYPEGNRSGAVATYSEYGLVAHEAPKSRRHIPIRDLFQRAFATMTALKPCILASPMAVAQHLPRDSGRMFDLLVIDEASQMRPEDAVGALARCRRAVIVGDQEQLPPSNFFEKIVSQDSDPDKQAELVTEESILDRALSAFPKRRLKWHYRSRHPSLIAYSNKAFYDDSLIVFPAADSDHPHFGVKLERVDGFFGANVNVQEADAICAAIVAHMKTRRDESLAVVTMNQQQRDLIKTEFDRLTVSDPELQDYLSHWTKEREGLEPFIVKNLENIQGDERDVVLISCVYGPARPGERVMQRFGPILGATGHRRLNVLFTRAKHQVRVFASLTATDVLAEEGRKGLKAFKGYLSFAATGHIDAMTGSAGPPESPFEESVLDELRRQGFDGVTQVGSKGFFIDIGVRHQSWPWGYIMAVECDGKSYHSSRCARDRDRLRQEILEGLGWRFHRIWSTDWFKDPVQERKRLKNALERRLAELRPEAERREATFEEAKARIETINLSTRPRRGKSGRTGEGKDSLELAPASLSGADQPTGNRGAASMRPPVANVDIGIRVGDCVTYAFANELERPITVTITENRNDPDHGFLPKGHPTVEQILGYGEGSEIEVTMANRSRYIRILKVQRPTIVTD